jgi:hypothetical protein
MQIDNQIASHRWRSRHANSNHFPDGTPRPWHGHTPSAKTIPTVLPYYAQDAVLWGTLSPTVRADRAALRDYFVTAFKVLPGLKVAFGDQLIRK